MHHRTAIARLIPVALALLASVGAAPAPAGPMTFHVDVNTAPPGVPAGTKGSLEFQFASSPSLPPGNSVISGFATDGSVVGPLTIFSGSAAGALVPGPLTISESGGSIADVAQDFDYGKHFSFDVTLSEPGAFSLWLWSDRAGNGSTFLTLPDFADSLGNGPALVLTVDDRGGVTIEGSAGVTATLIPEPSSLALCALAAAGLLGGRWWRGRRPAG